MTMRIGVVGSGRLGAVVGELVAAGAADAEMAGWAPVKEGTPPPEWAATAGLEVVPVWQELVDRVDAVVVDLAPALHWHEREVLSQAAFEAGRALLVDAPLADFPQVYDRIQGARRGAGARLWSVRPLRRTMAVDAAVGDLGEGGLGGVLAVHASLHLRRGGSGASFEQVTCDLLDCVGALTGDSLERVFVEGERSDGGAIEVVQAVGRTRGGAVVTFEVAQVLPDSLGEGRDLLIEVTGREGLLRIEPDRSAALVASTAVRRLSWREDTVREAASAWLMGADEGPEEVEADHRLITAMRMVKRSRAKGEAVGPEAAVPSGG